MKFALLICTDGISTPEKTQAMERAIPGWVEATDASGVRGYGHALGDPETATTVRVRDGKTLISDGPFAETKEFIGGFDILDCESKDEAIAIAAKHPISWFHGIEVRPFAVGSPVSDDSPDSDWSVRDEDEVLGTRYLLMMCADGIAGTEEDEEDAVRGSLAWGARAEQSGAMAFGRPLEHADTAVTVRVRNGETLLTDGPFAETKEFLAGLVIVDCPNLDDAIELAAEHPLARFHCVEVRPFAGRRD